MELKVDMGKLQTTVQNDRHASKEHNNVVLSMIEELDEKLAKILEQTIKTNGRVNRLEEKEEYNKKTRGDVEDILSFIERITTQVKTVLWFTGTAASSPLWFPHLESFIKTFL